MFPSTPSVYPVFVADQVLTAHDLNESFNYLDEQERLTRTDLIGIGIACGLSIQYDQVKNEITITKGCGVTSKGYLISVDTKKYTKATAYENQLKDKTYDNWFVNPGIPKTKKIDLWELKEASVDPAAFDLTPAFLNDPGNEKIVLLYVELLDVKNKNCDPNSCDDKGKHYEITFRPLLVSKAQAANLPVYNGKINQSPLLLPELKMRRFDVTSTPLYTSTDLFAAYLKMLTETFIKDDVAQKLIDVYGKLIPVLQESPVADPAVTAVFQNLGTKFKFLYDGTIGQSPNSILNTQYYYDFFADLMATYNELREKSRKVICECCPGAELFPQHLMLGEAIGFNELTSVYRQRFIPACIPCGCGDDIYEVKILFKKLISLINNFSVPDYENPAFKVDSLPIGITPSSLGKDFLSEKAIPFYYKVNENPDPLYTLWNADKSLSGNANKNLAYDALKYNNTDKYVFSPLEFDLEPYNFLRIEGHVGKNYEQALKKIDELKGTYRLPFDVIALSSDTGSIFEIFSALTELENGKLKEAFEVIKKHPCCFSDLFLLFDDWIARFFCCLLENMRYYMALPSGEANPSPASGKKHMSRLFLRTDTSYVYAADTIGQGYQSKLDDNVLDNEYCANVFLKIATGEAQPASALVIMPYKIDKMAEAIPDHITDFDMTTFESRYNDLLGTASQMRALFSSPNVAGSMEKINKDQLQSRLNFSCIICLYLELITLIREFLLRLLRVMLRQKLGYYATVNPGIQHKAGVTMGGTFIMVYHEEASADINIEKVAAIIAKLRNNGAGKSGAKKTALTQPVYSALLMEEEWDFLEDFLTTQKFQNINLIETAAKIKEGTVIADFYLPYLCCSDCPPVSYIFPKPNEAEPLKVESTAPVCAENGQSFSVVLTISGGTPPYTIDGQTVTGTHTVAIPNGQAKTITVEDGAGRKKDIPVAAQNCPQPITAAIGDPVCNENATKFTVLLTVSGGTPPYKKDGVAFAGNSVPVEITSGLSRSVTITDNAGKQFTTIIPAHTCPPPACNLPCDGKAERCNYILWIQKPLLRKPIRHKTDKANLLLTDENGTQTSINVINIFRNIVDAAPVSTANYDAVFAKLADELSNKIPSKFRDNNNPVFTYDAQNQLLTIEKFICQNITMELVLTLVNLEVTLHVFYERNQVVIENQTSQTTVQIPKFGCILFDKCKNETKELCNEQLQITDISGDQQAFGQPLYTFAAIPASFDKYYWYFPEGLPRTSEDKTPKNIQIVGTTKTIVRVIGIRKETGCFAIFEKLVDLTQING